MRKNVGDESQVEASSFDNFGDECQVKATSFNVLSDDSRAEVRLEQYHSLVQVKIGTKENAATRLRGAQPNNQNPSAHPPSHGLPEYVVCHFCEIHVGCPIQKVGLR